MNDKAIVTFIEHMVPIQMSLKGPKMFITVQNQQFMVIFGYISLASCNLQ